MIGDDVKITVTKIKGGKAFIGIEAPREIQVHRLEVYEKRKEQSDAKSD